MRRVNINDLDGHTIVFLAFEICFLKEPNMTLVNAIKHLVNKHYCLLPHVSVNFLPPHPSDKIILHHDAKQLLFACMAAITGNEANNRQNNVSEMENI